MVQRHLRRAFAATPRPATAHLPSRQTDKRDATQNLLVSQAPQSTRTRRSRHSRVGRSRRRTRHGESETRSALGAVVADRLTGAKCAVIDPQRLHCRRDLYLLGAEWRAQMRAEAAPAKLAVVAAVTEHAVDDERDNLWSAIDRDDDVVRLSGTNSPRSQDQEFSVRPSLSRISILPSSAVVTRIPRPLVSRVSSNACPAARESSFNRSSNVKPARKSFNPWSGRLSSRALNTGSTGIATVVGIDFPRGRSRTRPGADVAQLGLAEQSIDKRHGNFINRPTCFCVSVT